MQESVDLIGLNLTSRKNRDAFQQVERVLRERGMEGIILKRNVLSNSEYFSGLQKLIGPVLTDTHFAIPDKRSQAGATNQASF